MPVILTPTDYPVLLEALLFSTFLQDISNHLSILMWSCSIQLLPSIFKVTKRIHKMLRMMSQSSIVLLKWFNSITIPRKSQIPRRIIEALFDLFIALIMREKRILKVSTSMYGRWDLYMFSFNVRCKLCNIQV